MGTYYDNEVTPSSTTELEWLPSQHKYRLALDYAEKICIGVSGKSFINVTGSEERAEYTLNELMGDMYKFVYKYNRRDINKLKADEHKLAKNGDFKEVIRDAQADMLRAALRSGFSLDKDLSWVNPETGQVMDLSNLPAIAPDAIDGLLAYGVLHKGPYSYRIAADDYRSDY